MVKKYNINFEYKKEDIGTRKRSIKLYDALEWVCDKLEKDPNDYKSFLDLLKDEDAFEEIKNNNDIVDKIKSSQTAYQAAKDFGLFTDLSEL